MRFSRQFEKSTIRGYVLDVGPKFFLLALVNDRVWFDGFECFRIRDVTDLKPDPYAAFTTAALKKRRQSKPRKPRVDVSSIETILRSAGQKFPLVTIHREEVDHGVCWIGRVIGFSRGRLSLLEINPDATWDDVPNNFRLTEITRVNFGGGYENALYSVGADKVPARHVHK
jgi:hypothetical protein